MREITTHKVNPANDTLKIEVLDEPGAGGAHHEYRVSGFKHKTDSSVDQTLISFQNGPIADGGVNGLTQEALLAILQDRLEAFEAGPFACEENARALDAIKEAQHWLQFRTLKRMARGVEGTHNK